MEVELDLVTHLAAGHRVDVGLFHLGLYSPSIRDQVGLDRLVDRAAVGELHPVGLELLAIKVGHGSQLHLRLGHASSQEICLTPTTEAYAIETVCCLSWLLCWWLGWCSTKYVVEICRSGCRLI